MAHECETCNEEFSTLSRLRLHDCPNESEIFTVRVQARLITNDSNRYAQLQQPGVNKNQPVFPDFDLAVEPGTSVPPKSVQQQVSNELDDIFRAEHDLWGWADTISKSDVRSTPPAGQDVTKFHPVGTIEVADDGEIEDTFITLGELKTAVTSPQP